MPERTRESRPEPNPVRLTLLTQPAMLEKLVDAANQRIGGSKDQAYRIELKLVRGGLNTSETAASHLDALRHRYESSLRAYATQQSARGGSASRETEPICSEPHASLSPTLPP